MITTLRRLRMTCLAVAMLASPAAAQSSEWDAAAAAYGRGVHAYFAGRYGDAEASLARAQKVNPDDPRLFYFRALSLMRLGRSDEARSDMQVGALLEAQRPNRYGVGAALQRVQGGDRLVLEKYRRQALAGALAHQRLSRAQSEQRASDESQVLYQPVIVPLEGFLRPGTPPALSAEDLARRAAIAASRAAPSVPPQNATPQANPFQDDAGTTQEAVAAPTQPAPTARATEQPTEEAAPGDMGLESGEGDEGTSAPSPQPPVPDSTESEDDPFQDFQ